jgi:hypothetical protein
MFAHTFQVVIDAHDPHAQADWWAETLGWEVEPQDEAFIRSMVEQGYATEADTTTHHGRLVWATGAAINAPGAVGTPRVLFQWVPEAKTVKNRVHLDVRPQGVEAADVRASVVARGAVEIGSGRQGPHDWVVFRDLEGNEFCV